MVLISIFFIWCIFKTSQNVICVSQRKLTSTVPTCRYSIAELSGVISFLFYLFLGSRASSAVRRPFFKARSSGFKLSFYSFEHVEANWTLLRCQTQYADFVVVSLVKQLFQTGFSFPSVRVHIFNSSWWTAEQWERMVMEGKEVYFGKLPISIKIKKNGFDSPMTSMIEMETIASLKYLKYGLKQLRRRLVGSVSVNWVNNKPFGREDFATRARFRGLVPSVN